MGKLTRFLRRLAKPAAMFAVVGTLSLSLVVTTPSNAQAFVDTKATETFVKGAVKTIAPAANVAMTAASFTPVGFGVRLLQLGILAYSTSDIWMPIVAGAFGSPVDNKPGTAVGQDQPNIMPGLTIDALAIQGGRYGQIKIKWGMNYNSQTWATSIMLNCRTTAGGALSNLQQNIGTSNAALETRTFTLSCPSGQDLIGIVAGAGGTHSAFPQRSNAGGPENVRTTGTYSPEGFDPYAENVKYRVKNECIDAAGVKSTIEAESSGEMVKFPSCEAAGKGHGTGKTSITGLAPGTTVEQPLWDSPAAPSDPATPLCDASRASDGCVLSVELDGKPCTSADVECQNWAELEKQNPGTTRLRCKLGPYTLPTASCALLEKAYFPGGAPATNENTDGDPATQNWNDPRGKPIPAQPPSIATQTVPGGPGTTPTTAEPEQKNCFPTGWAMVNPIEWVMKPVGCALEAAFKPKKDVQTRLTTMQTQFANKVPVTWFGGGMANVSGGSCPANWAIDVAGQHVSLICGTEAESIILGFRPVLGAMLIIAALWPLVRSLFYAAIPILKVTPS